MLNFTIDVLLYCCSVLANYLLIDKRRLAWDGDGAGVINL